LLLPDWSAGSQTEAPMTNPMAAPPVAPVIPGWSPQDYAFLAEVLETEQRKLLVEIRHTRTAAFKKELDSRLRTVERLLASVSSR
jgi:hypothetical protein